MGSAEAGGFGLVDCGGVEFAVGGGGGFVAGLAGREAAGFCSGRSVYAALDHGRALGYIICIIPLGVLSMSVIPVV